MTQDKPKYDVDVIVFNRNSASSPDTIILHLYDPSLLPVVERFVKKKQLGVLQPLRDQPGNAYLLYRGRDAEQIAAQIRAVLWERTGAKL
jgi:hypothetical protein